jgi:hypothetical protein
MPPAAVGLRTVSGHPVSHRSPMAPSHDQDAIHVAPGLRTRVHRTAGGAVYGRCQTGIPAPTIARSYSSDDGCAGMP